LNALWQFFIADSIENNSQTLAIVKIKTAYKPY